MRRLTAIFSCSCPCKTDVTQEIWYIIYKQPAARFLIDQALFKHQRFPFTPNLLARKYNFIAKMVAMEKFLVAGWVKKFQKFQGFERFQRLGA